ncbi:MAG: UDP-N-acetylglucosamine 1-carboxyvinyltransferase [candidate division WOR-3 bacterium]|nr:MAG: UDP-N-acetylglucosamine 1-carboxyvinyltransferase [candidate division WOR-3 bacterium]
MARFFIEGGKRLSGEVNVSGAKNSALPIIAAALLTDKKVTLKNVPDVFDVRTMIELVTHLGARVDFKRNTLSIHTPKVKRLEAPYDIVTRMRASYYVLGALIAREKRASVAMPGGCAIGPRPIDLHIKGFTALGTKISITEGYINADARNLRGQNVDLQGPKGTSVGATINVMLAASRARGKTVISPAAAEPEVVDVANFLRALGVEISGQGSHEITVVGCDSFHSGVNYKIIPDRIEAGTFATVAAITRSRIVVKRAVSEHMTSVLEKLREIGLVIREAEDGIIVDGRGRRKATDIFVAPYPGFPTDMQAQFMALLSTIPGTSTIKESIFENRFMQAVELMRMGANITIEGDTAVIKGVKKLSGTQLMASDLRASSALVLAGLAAKGTTVVRRIYHLDRGYEKFEVKLRRLGASIRRGK